MLGLTCCSWRPYDAQEVTAVHVGWRTGNKSCVRAWYGLDSYIASLRLRGSYLTQNGLCIRCIFPLQTYFTNDKIATVQEGFWGP